MPFHQWIDNFHTGYNLECIYRYQEVSGDLSFQKNIDKGLDYYLNTFFTKEGISKYYNNKTYPIDIHAPAQLIVTLRKLDVLNKNRRLVDRVLLWTVENMQSPKVIFIIKRRNGVLLKFHTCSWAQSWMFYAFTYYFLEFRLKMNKIHILNTTIHNLIHGGDLEKLWTVLFPKEKQLHHVVVNAGKIVAMQKDLQLRQSVNEAI